MGDTETRSDSVSLSMQPNESMARIPLEQCPLQELPVLGRVAHVSDDSPRRRQHSKKTILNYIDTDLYYGNLAIINKNQRGETTNLSIDEWNKIYEFLFGGFENLDDLEEEDENEEDELENIPSSLKTKVGGYLKDDFVVDDDEDRPPSTDNSFMRFRSRA